MHCNKCRRVPLPSALEDDVTAATKWRFSWEVVEIKPGRASDILGHRVTTAEVLHQSSAPSTAVRVSDGRTTLAYSGDTEWTDALLPIADGAQLLIVECSGYAAGIPGHMTWDILKPRLRDLRARHIMITHMDPTVLSHLDEINAAGVLVATDGGVFDL